MKKSIFYPNLSTQGEITTEEEYKSALLSFYQKKYPNMDNIFINRIIILILYLVNETVGPIAGHLPNAFALTDLIKKVASFGRDKVLEICKTNHLSGNLFTLYAFYSGSIQDIKFNFEKRGITYSDEIATIAQEITKKIVDDVELATKPQLTFVEKYTKKPGEDKVQWANRVYSSSPENLTAKKDANPTRLVQFSSHKPTTINNQTGIVK
jgi:hypothetical protein